jgi:DNA polymerase elongation subunit (family B)
MSQQYMSAIQWGNKILFRGVSDGQRVESKDDFRPTLYTKTKEESLYKTLFGENLAPMVFDDINSAKDFVKRYDDVEGFEFFGNTWYQYQYLAEQYPDDIRYDPSLIKVVSLDIETEVSKGFPDSVRAEEKILLITVKNRYTQKIDTFGWRDFDSTKIKHFDATHFEYHKSRNEVEMLAAFLKFWERDVPDCVSGWYIENFDIPYLVNRIINVMPHNYHLKLSPWRAVQEKMVMENGREQQIYDIIGISTLDYIRVYKKFTPSKKQENYRLDTIAFVELGKNKLENPYDTFLEFYTNDFQLFTEYNIVDTLLVDQLEDKLRLLELVFLMAYRARSNFSDVFSPTRLWDCLIYNELLRRNIAPPQPRKLPKVDIVGGYVRNPPPGRYDNVVSVDATSLYPNIMLQYNMSPETLIQEKYILDASVEGFLNKSYDMSKAVADNVAVAVNGYAFDRTRQGFLAQLVEKMFNERVATKKKQIEAEKLYEKTKDIIYKDDAKRLKMHQESTKILLNSCFGAFANNYFRWSDTRIAEGITMSGQYVIQQVASDIDAYLNKVCETTDTKYVFYIDTDSSYITLKNMADKFFQDAQGNELIDILDQISKEKLASVIEKSCSDIAIYGNAFKNTTNFKRESIANRSIWTSKKRYVLNVADSEGVRYTEPKIKITGFESNRSSTPQWARNKFKEVLRICLLQKEEELQSFIKECREEYATLPPEIIGTPKPASGLSKYSDSAGKCIKGTPIQSRAAILYNRMLKENKLEKKYQIAQEGDKIKIVYLKEPNPLREKIIGWVSKLPPEFGLHPYIDYDIQYEKTFLNPVVNVLDAISWSYFPKASLSAFY